MSHLLQLSIGPVQPFIAASRKTRDLKAGSDLLVATVRAVLTVLDSEGAETVFPYMESGKPQEADGANIILAVVGDDPEGLSQRCKKAATDYLLSEWNCLKELPSGIDRDLARKQIASFIEFYAAWVPYPDAKEFDARRRELGRLHAARKALRDFGAAPSEGAQKPKSPLNPGFDTVLPLGTGWAVREDARRRLCLKSRETLDGMSLLKRMWLPKGDKSFPSTRWISCLPLIAAASNLPELQELEDQIKALNANGGIDLDLGDALCGEWSEVEEFNKANKNGGVNIKQAKDLAWAILKNVNDGKAPRNYYAVIHADGDSMGRYLDGLKEVGQQREFSRLLSGFAKDVKGLFAAALGEERKPTCDRPLLGRLVYAGGDDVVALCPAEHAIEWAKKIHGLFENAMANAPGTTKPTLTVGVAVCHVMSDLQQAVDTSIEMEHEGKKLEGKNALSIGVKVRGGGLRAVALPWNLERKHVETVGATPGDRGPDALFGDVVAAYQERRISRGFGYEIERLGEDMAALKLDNAAMSDLIQREHERICSKKSPEPPGELRLLHKKRIQGSDPPKYELVPNPGLAWVKTTEDLTALGKALTIGHFLTRTGEDSQ